VLQYHVQYRFDKLLSPKSFSGVRCCQHLATGVPSGRLVYVQDLPDEKVQAMLDDIAKLKKYE